MSSNNQNIFPNVPSWRAEELALADDLEAEWLETSTCWQVRPIAAQDARRVDVDRSRTKGSK